MRPTPSHARYSLDHQERKSDSCKRRQHSSHTHKHTHTELHPWAGSACTSPLPPSCTLCPLATLIHSHLMHIHSLSWLKQLLAFCWREPFTRLFSPLVQLFSCCLYIGSQPQNNIFYIRSSLYIFLASVLFRFRYLCCHVLLALFTRRHLLYLVWYLLLATPAPSLSSLTRYLFAFHWRKGVSDKPGQKRKFAMEINSYAPLAVKRGIGKKERKAT